MILVTGGAGYIGSHAVKALRAAGYEPVVFDDFSTGHRAFVRGVPCVEGNICRREDIDRAFDTYRLDGVLHFAGRALISEANEKPDLYYETNVGGGVNLLRAMVDHGVLNIIFSSTCATYGIPETLPLTEDHRQCPINPYGETKLAFERALQWFEQAYGIRHLSLRYFNAAGADPDGEFGEDHDPETHLIPLVLETAAGRRPSARIHGADYPTPDGTCLRDYVHVTDLADAHVVGLEKLMRGEVGSQALNLGTGRAHSVREVIASVRRVTGKDFPVEEAARRPGDPPHLVASPARAERVLGWNPRHSRLDFLVESAWRWTAARMGPYNP